MKNIVLKALNCSALLCGLMLLTISCKKHNTPETFNGNQARPVWVAPDNHDMTSSMTAVIKVDLSAQHPNLASDFVLTDNDLLAAFSGDICLGVASQKDGLFFLYITDTQETVKLHYYSGHYKNLFVSPDAFEFVNDTQLGTVSAPYTPKFVLQSAQ